MSFLPSSPLDEDKTLEEVGLASLGTEDVIHVTGEKLPMAREPDRREPPLDDT